MPFQSGLKYQKYIQFRFLFHRITTEIVIGCSKDDKSASKAKYSRRNFIINRSDVYLSCIRTCQDLSIFFQISKFIFYRYFHQYYIINNIINILTGPNTVLAFIQPQLQDFRHNSGRFSKGFSSFFVRTSSINRTEDFAKLFSMF